MTDLEIIYEELMLNDPWFYDREDKINRRWIPGKDCPNKQFQSRSEILIYGLEDYLTENFGLICKRHHDTSGYHVIYYNREDLQRLGIFVKLST